MVIRIVPSLLFSGFNSIKSEKHSLLRYIGSIEQSIRINARREPDELLLIDVSGNLDTDLLSRLTALLFCPVCYGGGIRSIANVQAVLRFGADRVIISSRRPELIREAARELGSQAITASVDDGSVDTAKLVVDHGVGEILLSSPARDGLLCGYDLDLIREVSAAVAVPVVARGGCSGYPDMLVAVEAGASAVSAGALFQFTAATPKGAALYLADNGVRVRL